MSTTTVMTIIPKSMADRNVETQNLIRKSAALVSEGRYLITVFELVHDFEIRIPIESLVIEETLGPLDNRRDEWEFFGNGVVRCYSHDLKNHIKTFQWVITRRSGLKPYSRKNEMNLQELSKNRIPVGDKTFTRDVANNVWHLRYSDLQESLIKRFSSLLTWQDEEFLFFSGARKKQIHPRKKLDLSEDLVGVPNKVLYAWNSKDLLF